MLILLTAYKSRCNSISQANNQEIQQLSEHTHLRSDLTKLYNAGKWSQMKPTLIESVSQDYIPSCWEAFNFSFRHSDTSIFSP